MGCTKEASLSSLLANKRMWFKISTCLLLFSDLAIADLLGYLAMHNGELWVYNTDVLACNLHKSKVQVA